MNHCMNVIQHYVEKEVNACNIHVSHVYTLRIIRKLIQQTLRWRSNCSSIQMQPGFLSAIFLASSSKQYSTLRQVLAIEQFIRNVNLNLQYTQISSRAMCTVCLPDKSLSSILDIGYCACSHSGVSVTMGWIPVP